MSFSGKKLTQTYIWQSFLVHCMTINTAFSNADCIGCCIPKNWNLLYVCINAVGLAVLAV